MKRGLDKAWALTDTPEKVGDALGAIVGLRKVRECPESLDEMLERAEALKAGSQMVFTVEFIGEKGSPQERKKARKTRRR